MNHRLNQNTEEFQPPTIERAINDVKALLTEMDAEREKSSAAFKRAGCDQRSQLNTKILELLQAVLEEADPDPGVGACTLAFKET
jgi:hypothetical protein